MAREPELSIKVKVDPQINKAKLEEDVRAQVSNIKKLPAVPITPDVSNLQDEIKKGLGGPYSVDIEPNLEKNLTQQINDEIAAAQNGAQQIKVKLDVKEFGNDLSKQLKEQLRGVNRTLSNYLKEMQTNLALANKATYGLFGGGNRDVTVDSIFNEISKKDIKKAQTLNRQLNDIYSEMPKLKETGKISADSDITSIDQMSKALINLSNSLSLMSKAWDEVDESVYNSTYKDFEKTYDSIKNAIVQLEELYNAPGALKNLNIKGSILKNFIDNAKGGLEDISNLRGQGGDYSVFSKSVENYQDLLDYASTFTHLNDLIGQSIDRSKKEIDGLKKSEQESIGAGIPIDSSVLDENTKKIIQSIGEVSAAMDGLESKSKNFSNNLTVEVDKHVDNIEEKVKQLKTLIDVLPNGQKNTPGDSKGQEDPTDGTAGTEDGPSSVSIRGKVVITNADVSVDVKDPVQIPGVVVVDSDGVQFGNTEELQKNVNSITSAKKALQSVVNKTESYVSEIAELGPAFQYVAQEVDNLSHSLENQIANFTRISELTNNYIDKSNSIKIDTSTIAVTGEPAAIDGKVILSANDVVAPETPVDIKGHVTLEVADITPPKTPVEVKGKIVTTTTDTETKGKKKKSQDDIEKPELIELKGHIKLEDKDIERPDPIVMNGKVTVTKDNIKLPEGGIDVKGNLILKNAEIVDAVKEATKEAARKAQSKQSTAKTKNGLTDRDFERKSKELLTSLASIMKGKARVQNSLTTHTRKGQSEAAAEDSYYLSKLSRRERTTKGKLTKLYKGRGGRSAWQSSSIYHSATEDSEHIRNSRVAENSDKDKVAEEEKYIAALRQRSKIYKELAAARRKYGDDSEYVKSSQKELQNTLDIISQFESKVGSQYLQAMPERRKVFAENMSNFRKNRDDIRHKNTQIAAKDQQKAIVATNKSVEKERITSEKEFLENLAKEPKLWADAEKARKKYGDNSAEAKQAEYLRDKNQSSINDFKSNYTGSLSDIPGYDDQVKDNNFAMAAYQSGMTRKANAEQQKQHDAAQAAFQKRRDEAAKQAEAAQKAVEKSSIDMVNRVAKSIEESKKIYLDAEKEIIKRQAELLTTEDSATKQDIIDKISDAKNLKKTAGARINSYSGDYTGLVQNAWDEINSEKKSYKIDQSLANEQKSNKEIAATFDEIIGKYSELDKLEQRRSKLFKPEDVQQLQDVDEAIVKLTDDITTLEIKALDSGIDLHANSDYSNKVAESSKISKESAVTFTNNQRTYDVNTAKESYLANYKDWLQNMDYIDRIDPNSVNAQELISRYQKRADENKQAIDTARQILSINNDISKDAWDEIQRWKDSLSITDAEKAAKEAQKATAKKDSDDAAFFTKLQTAVSRKIKAYDDFIKAEPGTKDWVSKSGKNNIADNNLLDLQNQATATGLSSDQRYSSIMGQYRKDINAVNEAQQKRAKIEEEATKVQDKDIISLQKFIKTVDAYKGSIEKDNKTDMPAYANVTNIRGSANDLLNRLRKDTSGDKDQVAID